MSIRPPDFIIGGAPRSGTTWLYQLLDRHPELYLAKPRQPEPKFFLVDDSYRRGMNYYLRTWFADNAGGKIAGEKSSNYLESATAAGRISRDLPAVKLIFILREPAERAFSNWLWSRQNGLESADFVTALDLEAERERTVSELHRYSRPHAYFSRGLYADLVLPYLAAFSRSQLLFLLFEDMVARPGALATSVHAFLGVSARPDDARDLGVVNPSQEIDVSMPADVRRRLGAAYAESNNRLRQLLGLDLDRWDE